MIIDFSPTWRRYANALSTRSKFRSIHSVEAKPGQGIGLNAFNVIVRFICMIIYMITGSCRCQILRWDFLRRLKIRMRGTGKNCTGRRGFRVFLKKKLTLIFHHLIFSYHCRMMRILFCFYSGAL